MCDEISADPRAADLKQKENRVAFEPKKVVRWSRR